MMKSLARLLLLVIASTISFSAQDKAASSGHVEARRVVEQFERGLQERKLELIEAVVAPDLVAFENGHRNDGWVDFRDRHLVPEMKEPSPPAQRELVRLKAGADMAWAYTRTTIQVKRADGTTADLLIWSIYILEKRAGEWKIVSLDWSITSKRSS